MNVKLNTVESKEYCSIPVGDKRINFFIPNGPCLWRAQTLKTKEPWTLEWIDSFDKDDIFWDVGANVGVYTLYAAVMKGVKTFAFEPEAANYRVLNENIRINKVTPIVRAYCMGISDKVSMGDLGLSIIETGSSNHQVRPKQNPAFVQGVVTYPLDILCNYLPKPTRLKIDVDGIEHLIVKGGLNIALPNVKSIMVELYSGDHPNIPNTYNVVRPMLEQNGFKLVQEVSDRSVHKEDPYKNMGEHLFTR
ncbi:FkbM family methyltransferase [bacterium]|nr:FkbM family methyltransferase [bacterium]